MLAEYQPFQATSVYYPKRGQIPTHMAVDSAGNLYCGLIPYTSLATNGLMKLNSSGEKLWAVGPDPPAPDWTYNVAEIVLYNNETQVTFVQRGAPTIHTYDSNGNLLWTQSTASAWGGGRQFAQRNLRRYAGLEAAKIRRERQSSHRRQLAGYGGSVSQRDRRHELTETTT